MATFDQMSYGPLGEAVEGAMPTSEADPIGVWAASLSLYSAAISRRVRLANKRPVVVWTVLAGRSAIGRKGYALNTATALLSGVCGGFIHARKRAGVASGPSLVDMLAGLELDTAGARDGMDGRCVLLEEEWASVLKDQKKCSKFSTFFRSAWDGKPISNRTKKEGLVTVAQPLLGFHAHITPGEWGKYVSASEALGGSYNRLLPVLVERSKMLPYDNRPQIPDVTLLRESFEWANGEDERVMRFSEEAGERFDEIRALVEDRMAELPELLASYMERSAEQVHRVAAVLSATEMTETIGVDAVEAAWAFVSFSMDSVEKLVKEAANNGVAAKPMRTPEDLIRDVLTRCGGIASGADLLRPLWGKLNAAAIKAAVGDMDDVETWTEKTGRVGAPKTMYRLLRPEAPAEPREATVIEMRARPEPEPATPPMPANIFAGLI
ncbi:DUF3987 domain-containing protein [Streptomyces sp. p1417]|uniref:DUF3987 domain-containing protein n=1 Tax=Streptomyces typhae TaxID=2681492 RepID=A0A6L6X184_9ACTN|nr:DUF3987 domain-containing protein [Streptomyces typhae]MVO87440.1 DUF3987 domain-containing protein [Streptomyces typhae]